MSSALRALSGRTPATGEVIVTRCMVRKHTLDGTPLAVLSEWLRRENFTGNVTLGVSKGSIRTISAEDRQAIEA